MKSKYCLLFVFLVVLLPVANAAIELTNLKGYVNNERDSNIDEDGGEFEVNQDDNVEISVTIDNTYNTTTQIKLELVVENIDDGEDIEKTQGWYDIGADDDKTKSISFIVPNDARADDYDMDLSIYYKLSNGTEYLYSRIDFNVYVEKGRTDVTEENINDVLKNLSSSCGYLAMSTNVCFGYIGKYDNCSDELSTVKEERGEYKQKASDCESTLSSCNSDKSVLENDKQVLSSRITAVENERDGRLTQQQCNNITATAVNQAKDENTKSFNNMIGMGAIAAIGFWYYNKRKKAKESVASSYQDDYYNK